MKALLAWLGDTLFHKQRKLFVAGCEGLALLGGYLYAANRASAVEPYRIFAEWSVFLTGLFMAGNSSVHLWQAKFGTPAEKK